ncbi:probable small nuclear ribonucleoprotein G [Schistocerca gregaria]|uniref:probable small nuclear ribonucleoprotein G n=1 Tax=Schistocerca gregaria TaxID=7010 RepID=UPI00211EB1A2|nr:probable small nuclear ribonucleoprotein G [Schistocerca gregaria]
MNKVGGPDLKKFMEKRLLVKINGGRQVTGILRGYDQYLNLVLDNAVEEVSSTERNQMGSTFIRGSSVLMVEPVVKS